MTIAAMYLAIAAAALSPRPSYAAFGWLNNMFTRIFGCERSTIPGLPEVRLSEVEKRTATYSQNDKPVVVYKITENEFDQLPPGTALVELSTGRVHIVGYNFFNLGVKDADGFLNYGFSEAITEQPFVKNPEIRNFGQNYRYDSKPGETRGYSARGTLDSHTFELDLPPSAKSYLALKSYGWRSTGGETRFENIPSHADTIIVYFTYAPDYAGRENSYAVRSISVFLGWGLIHDLPKLQKYQKIAEEIGVAPPTAGDPSAPDQSRAWWGNPRIELETREQIEGFFAIMVRDAAGVQALVDAKNKYFDDYRSGDLADRIREFKKTHGPR